MGAIYIIKNIITDDNYIGKTTKSILERFKRHLDAARYLKACQEANIAPKRYEHSHLYNAMIKYGIDNFKIYELETDIPDTELNKREKFWIAYYRSINQATYNIANGGDGGDLFSGHTDEEKAIIRAKISAATSGENNPMYGKHHTDDTKLKIKQSYTPERIEKYKELNTGKNNPMYGKDPWNKGIPQSDEFKEKCRIANTGKNNNNYGRFNGDAFNHKPVTLIKPDGTKINFSCKKECGEYLGYSYGGNVPLSKIIKSSDPNRNGCIVKYTEEIQK